MNNYRLQESKKIKFKYKSIHNRFYNSAVYNIYIYAQ